MMQVSILLTTLILSITLLTGCSIDSDRDALPSPEIYPVGPTKEFSNVFRVTAGGRLCSGGFISEKALITASHCIKERHHYEVHSELGTFSTELAVKNGPGRVGDTQDIALLIFPQSMVELKDVFTLGESIFPQDTVYLVGYGCTKIIHGRLNGQAGYGAGIRRLGTNRVYRIAEYIELLTPRALVAPKRLRILGPQNRAGSCFGDSGGPLLKKVGLTYQLVGIDHAGITKEEDQVSQYVNLTRPENKNFLRHMNEKYDLKIPNLNR